MPHRGQPRSRMRRKKYRVVVGRVVMTASVVLMCSLHFLGAQPRQSSWNEKLLPGNVQGIAYELRHGCLYASHSTDRSAGLTLTLPLNSICDALTTSFRRLENPEDFVNAVRSPLLGRGYARRVPPS